MPTVYNLLASQVPAIVVPGALLSITGAAPNVAATVTAGSSGSGSLTTPFNRNAVRVDALGRAGAGAYAVDWDSNPASAVLPGLDLTVSAGLTLAIAAGQAVLDSVVQQLAATTKALSDNMARIYLWLSANGVITAVNNSTAKPGVTGAEVFLGSCVTSGGAITEIDGSGVLYYRGSHLWRRTADTTVPTDTPPAGVSFFNMGAGGVWLWTGVEYVAVAGAQTALFPTLIDTGDTVVIPSGYGAVAEELTVNGTLVVDGRLRVGGF